MPDIELQGCRTEPLISYLKSIGILRIIAQQAEAEARGFWRNGHFVLNSKLGRSEVIDFMLNTYVPTPIVVPWSGSMFFDTAQASKNMKYSRTPTGAALIRAFRATKSERLEPFRDTIELTHKIIRDHNLTKKDISDDSGKKQKADFLSRLRSTLPDSAIHWIDATTTILEDEVKFNALLGSGGGSDGRAHFSDNYMQNLWDCLPDFQDQRKRTSTSFRSNDALEDALFEGAACRLIKGRTSALFDAGAVGGPNAGQGMERESFTNPWNFIFGLEGSLCLAGSVVRKSDVASYTVAIAAKETKHHSGSERESESLETSAFPFTVQMVAAGYGTAVSSEAKHTEIWLPLWSRQLALPELTMLFSEGRAELGRKRAKTGTDFLRAVSNLGVDAGFDKFNRFGIIKGRVGGDNYYTAVRLGETQVRTRPHSDLLNDLDRNSWLAKIRIVAGGKGLPLSFQEALRNLDNAIFAYCSNPHKSRLLNILIRIGRLEQQISRRRERFGKSRIPPCPTLSQTWFSACDDDSIEFRIAGALASIHSPDLRTNLEPVVERDSNLQWDKESKSEVWSATDLSRNMISVLERRLIDSEKKESAGLPLEANYFARLDDIKTFLDGAVDERRIEDLLWGIVLVDRAQNTKQIRSEPVLLLPRVYALLKLLFLPKSLALRSTADDTCLRPESEITHLLRAGNKSSAVDIAVRRLRSSGFFPMTGRTIAAGRLLDSDASGLSPIRLAASLLIPIASITYLENLVLRKSDEKKGD